jgi:hypothetical protein
VNPLWPRFSRVFRALGWAMVAAWIYMNAFVVAVNLLPDARPYFHGALWRIFRVAFEVGFFVCPAWMLAAVVLTLIAALQKQIPSRADHAVFLLLLSLIGGYFFLGFLD